MGRPVACLFFFVCALWAADDPLSWYPLQVGHTWVYDSVSKNGDRKYPEIARWTATVTVREQIPTANGLVVPRSLELQGTPNPPHGFRGTDVPLLVRGNCIYPLYSGAWDTERRTFKPGWNTYLKQVSPMFCFPLQMGASWTGTGDWAWTVEGNGPIEEGPQDVPAEAVRLKSNQSGSTEYVWFQKGVGPVASWSWHNGTYTEGFERLRAATQ